MNKLSNYMHFLKEHGRPLSEINPGSDEMALTLKDALQAIEFLRDAEYAILGGDILSAKSGRLTYTHENWYSERLDHETHGEFCMRSYFNSTNYLIKLIEKGDDNIYAVIVI